MILTVNTLDLRQALMSVIPHAADAKLSSALAVVHFTATDGMLHMTASNTVTLGHAVASVWDSEGLSGEVNDDAFNLPTDVAKELLQIFKAHGKQPEDEIGDTLRITVRPDATCRAHRNGGGMNRVSRLRAWMSYWFGRSTDGACLPVREDERERQARAQEADGIGRRGETR